MHEFTLISTIAAGLGLALVLGYVASRIGAPPLVGYLVAGILVGPATPGYVADMELTTELAEIGVMLMMFGVGLHFSVRDLMAVQRIAVPGAIVQIAVATGLAALTARSWGWDLGASLVFGIALSVASTVVLLRALEARRALHTVNGQIAVGWLIVEDLFVVLVLVVLPAVAGLLGGSAPEGHPDESVGRAVMITFGKVAAFVALMLVVGRRVLPRVLWLVARTGSRELFTLAVMFAAIDPVVSWVRSSSVRARALERSPDPLAELPSTVDVRRLTGHVLIVGYGRVGRRIADTLAERGIPFVVAEERREAVEALRTRQVPAVSGDASEPEVLVQAHVARAGMLVIATSDTARVRRMVEIARTLNPRIEIVIRVHSEEEKALFEEEGLGRVFLGEEALAISMTAHILDHAARVPV